MTAELEEVVVVGDLFDTQQLDPHHPDRILRRRHPRRGRGVRSGRRGFVDGLAVELAAEIVDVDRRTDQPRMLAGEQPLDHLDTFDGADAQFVSELDQRSGMSARGGRGGVVLDLGQVPVLGHREEIESDDVHHRFTGIIEAEQVDAQQVGRCRRRTPGADANGCGQRVAHPHPLVSDRDVDDALVVGRRQRDADRRRHVDEGGMGLPRSRLVGVRLGKAEVGDRHAITEAGIDHSVPVRPQREVVPRAGERVDPVEHRVVHHVRPRDRRSRRRVRLRCA